GTVKRSALVRYRFRAGQRIGRDQLLVREAGYFGSWSWPKLHRQRFLITPAGRVVDAHRGKLLLNSYGVEVLDIRDDRVYLGTPPREDPPRYFYQDLSRMRTVRMREPGVWDLPGLLSPDGTMTVALSDSKRRSLSEWAGRSLWLHRPGEEPHKLSSGL